MNDFLVDVSGNNYGRNAYVNRNYLLTSDNKYAYINSKGVVKPYDSMADYNSTYGKNQCGGSKINITSSLANLPLPIGKQMATGQSCGNENSYVRYDFPARLNEVSSSWLTDVSGRAVGTLPYPSLLSDMAKVGKAGYIDVDTTYHSITPTFSNTYGSAIATYITGETSKMENCSPSSVTMKYGDKIILLADNYLQKNSSNSLIKSNSPTEMFILPASQLQVLGTDVQYGDDVYLSLTDSLNCGNNCAVGGVTYLNEFKFGGAPSKHAMTISSAGNVDSTVTDSVIGTPVRYTENVYLSATVYMNRLLENQMIANNGNGLKSNTEDGMTAYLTFSNGKIKVQVNNGAVKTLNSNSTYVSSGYLQFLNGRLYVKKNNGTTVQIYPTVAPTFSGNTPYELFLCNNGLVVVLDANRQIQWQSDPTLETDMVYDGYMVYANMTNNTFKFNNTAAVPQNIFSFSKKAYGLTNSCDVESLKKKCVDVSGCAGFLHSPYDNTWMKMMNNATASDYAVSAENTNAYLRNMTSDMKDTSCPSATYLKPLPATLLNGYPVGKEMTNTGTSQCNIFNSALNLTEYEKSVNEARQNINNFERNDLSIKVNNLEKYYANINKNKNEYTSIYNLFNDAQKDNGKTGDQQLKDSAVMESQEKTVTFIWGVVSISMLLIILFRPRLNTV